MSLQTSYRDAAVKLWGDGGAYVHDFYDEHLHLFPELPASMPIVIGITAYGKCVGLSRLHSSTLERQRITIASRAFKRGLGYVSDIMLHEMMHCALELRGLNTDHATQDWYDECERLAPYALGREVSLTRKQRKSIRVPNPKWKPGADVPKTLVKKKTLDVEFLHADIARFPQGIRPSGHDFGEVIHVDSY